MKISKLLDGVTPSKLPFSFLSTRSCPCGDASPSRSRNHTMYKALGGVRASGLGEVFDSDVELRVAVLVMVDVNLPASGRNACCGG